METVFLCAFVKHRLGFPKTLFDYFILFLFYNYSFDLFITRIMLLYPFSYKHSFYIVILFIFSLLYCLCIILYIFISHINNFIRNNWLAERNSPNNINTYFFIIKYFQSQLFRFHSLTSCQIFCWIMLHLKPFT